MDNEQMTTYDFHEYNADGTVVELEFVENEDKMNCARFHEFCKRFAYACGYMSSTIEKYFGPTRHEEKLP